MKFFRSLQWRIVLAYTALIFISMGAVSIYLVSFVRDSYISGLEERLQQEAGLVGETTARYFRGPLDSADLQVVSERMGKLIDARVTVIARDGTVLADTWESPRTMENHLDRPEVQHAINNGLGKATRLSASVGQELLYTAVPIRIDGTLMGVSRIAVPTAQIQANVNRIIATIVLAALVVTALSVALGYYLARRTSRSIRSVTEAARRLSQGDLEHRVEALSSDETEELAEAFNRMAEALRDMIHQLSSEGNKLSALLDTMADGVVVIGANGRVELLNRAAEVLLSVKSTYVVGARFLEAVRDHGLERLVSRSLETKEQQQGEVELLRPRRFLSAIATPLARDGASGVLLTLHDLTSVRRLETTRKEFVSNVSHELRTPIASIKAMAETLEDGAIDSPQVAKDFLRRINKEIDRMSTLVGELLELSLLESGQAALSLIPLDLRSVVEDVKQLFESRAVSKGVTVEVALPEALPQVIGDSERLRQVFINLLDNALKFTPPGGKISISALVVEGGVELRVSDTGIGIAEEHLPHIFERFYKVDKSRRDEGTGLGLAIVKHIILSHKGEVRVESKEGVGTTFAFTLPRLV